MTLLTRKLDYALLILWYLNHRGRRTSARDIAAHFGISPAFVANILKELGHKGFVASHRGIAGGYLLNRGAAEMSLAQLMDALDDSFHLAECTNEPEAHLCSLESVCPVRGVIGEVHRRIHEVLRNVTLAELFGRPAQGYTQLGLSLGIPQGIALSDLD
jgi:Rrf2 family cysteine metabolism transcriptional repressor